MSVVRRLAALCCTVLVASALVVMAPFLTSPAAAAELLVDGGFESSTASDPPNSPGWTEADSAQGAAPGSPLCPSSNCSSTSVYTPPRTGAYWARFGGPVGVSTHTSSLSQSVTIPSGGTAVLTYWYRNGRVETPFNATLQVRVDGTTLKTHTEAATAESAYTQQTVNLSAYANGASHTISFNYANFSGGDNRMGVDDISLTYTPPVVTGTPTVTSTTPASPSSSTTPLVKGTAETGSTVTLYSNNTCSSAALGTGSAATFAGTGITATVPANATTTIWARATKTGQSASACSSTSVSYTNDSAAPGLVTLTSVTPASPSPNTSPVVKGTAEAGSTVRLYKTSDCSGTPAATGSAAAFASPGLTSTVTANTTTTFKATATDAVGNTSACSTSSLTYVNDATAPALVTLTSVTPASPSSSTTPAVKGTAEAGSTVNLYTTSDCSGTPASTGTAAAFASPGFTVTVASGSTTTFKARATDAAGNTSACSTSSLTYVNDASAPGLVTFTSVTPASPGSSLTPVVQGTAEAGSTVRLYKTGDCSGTPAVTGTAAAFASPGLTVSVTAGSTTTLKGTSTDPAGNTSACSTSTLTYVQDSVAPAPVTVTGVTPDSPNTSSTPVVTGTAEAGSTVKLYATAGCTGSPAATGTAAAFASAGLTATVVLGSTTTFRATATDAAGNTSACSTSSVTYISDLRDGGFEAAAGNPPNSPDWTEADSLAWPLCDATCTPGPEIAPHAGNAFVWFGGLPNAGHTGSVAQTVTIPVGNVALNYWYRNSSVTAPFDAVLMVQVDGTTLKTHTEAPVADAAYSKQVVDLSPFADGASHVLAFSYVNGGAGVTNMLLDDVGLTPGAAPHTATPTVSATVPASPSSTVTTPKVTGTSEAGSTVTLYSNGTCTSAALGTGSAAEFAAAGITATVPSGATTTIFAKAVKAGQNDSACSTTFVSYTHVGPPDTTLTKIPKKTVRTAKRKAKVAFFFSSATAGATFACSIDGKAFVACVSGHKYKLKLGKHTFAVRALAFGLTDASPATCTVKVKRRKRH